MDDQRCHYAVSKLKQLASQLGRVPLVSEFTIMLPRFDLMGVFGSYDSLLKASGLHVLSELEAPKLKSIEPKILTLDIETKPLLVYCFGLFDQNIGIDQIVEDWSVMSWAAKWHSQDDVMYQDVSQNKNFSDDKMIIHSIHDLLNEADVIITQNGKRFDIPKLYAKFLEYDLGLPTPYQHIDTYTIKKKLGLTSKKLAYTTNKFNVTYKKLKHEKFSGMKLWMECLKGNQEAWAEMKEYNIHDVLSLEELYFNHLISFDKTLNYGVFNLSQCCPTCGSKEIVERGISYSKTGAFQNYRCNKCKAHSQSKHNELSASKKKNLLK